MKHNTNPMWCTPYSNLIADFVENPSVNAKWTCSKLLPWKCRSNRILPRQKRAVELTVDFQEYNKWDQRTRDATLRRVPRHPQISHRQASTGGPQRRLSPRAQRTREQPVRMVSWAPRSVSGANLGLTSTRSTATSWPVRWTDSQM